jgi:hypothetical protein
LDLEVIFQGVPVILQLELKAEGLKIGFSLFDVSHRASSSRHEQPGASLCATFWVSFYINLIAQD